MVDKNAEFKDTPNDYVELADAKSAIYIRFKNLHCPSPLLALSDIRIFGLGKGRRLTIVQDLHVKRTNNRLKALINRRALPCAHGWGYHPINCTTHT